MKSIYLFLSVIVISSLIFSTVSWKEETKIPEGWTIENTVVDLDEEVPIILGLKQKNKDKLDQLFWAVSDPKSSQYGQYLSLERLTKLVSPSEATLKQVNSWLEKKQLTSACSLSKSKDFLRCSLSRGTIQKVFQTEYSEFFHAPSKARVVRALRFVVPEDLIGAIDLVSGIVGFPIKHSIKKVNKPKNGEVGTVINITPKVLRQRYQVPEDLIGSQPSNAQAVAEFQAQYYSPDDLTQFFTTYVPGSNASKIVKVVGTNDPSSPQIEASLDVQYIMGVAPNVPTWFWSNPQFDFWSDLTNWVAQIGDTTNPPYVHSISYGSQGNYPAESYRSRLDTEFQKLGVRGLSIIFASGDSGTGCSFCIKFQPSFPATSPYVTSVGATEFINSGVGPERAVQSFGSGGGFSLFFPTPSYQNDSVNHYFQVQKDLPDSFFYNRNGRATPDVAAMGIGYQVINGGDTISVGGTSASAPTFAGIVSLLNDIRIKNGKPTLGFLNPFIYQTFANHPEAFFDVTTGGNRNGCCGLTGFQAAPGWDPVTGVGTPNFSVLAKLV